MAAVLDLTAPRRAAMLDRLAEFAAGCDVRRLLDDQAAGDAAEGGTMVADVMTMRMPAGTLAALDELLDALADSPEPMARFIDVFLIDCVTDWREL